MTETEIKAKFEEIGGICIQLNTLDDCLNQSIYCLKGHTAAPIYDERLEKMETLRGIILEKIEEINKIANETLDVIEAEEKEICRK